jgi:NADPH2:quinone reductase
MNPWFSYELTREEHPAVRAIILHEIGDPANLRVEEIPVPAPAPGEILVRTEAIGSSFTEAALRSGTVPAPLELPATFGCEAAGTVTAAGDEVGEKLIGQRVVILHPGLGCYADYVAVPASAAVVIPDGMDPASAVAVANWGAVALCLVRRANLTGKETVLVEVAAGGVGGYLMQLVRQRADRVIATAGSEAKADFARSLGADEVLDHTDPDWTGKLSGVDVALESIGGATTARLLDGMTSLTGRILTYGFLSGPPELTPMELLHRGLTLTGCGGPAWLEQVMATRAEVMQMALDGQLKPVIDSQMPLTDAARAHQKFDNREAIGKIILIP